MADDISVVAQTRTEVGSAESRRLRRAGWLPGVVNRANGESQLVKMETHAFDMMLHHHTSENLMIDIKIDEEKASKVLLKEVHHHPVTGALLHVDFIEVSMDKKMRVHMPIALVGEPVGLALGGVLEQTLREFEVECLPGDLIEQYEIDVTSLEIGDALLVRDIEKNPKITILASEGVAVAAVAAPRVEAEPSTDEEAEGEAEEGAEDGSDAAAESKE